jgi:hypothetical protein
MKAHRSLRRQVRWSVRQPGDKPIVALGQALADLGMIDTQGRGWPARLRTTWAVNRVLAEQTPADHLNILILDQFEEVFTLAGTEDRLLLCEMLAVLGTFGRVRTQVIATLRADFLPALFDVQTLFARATRDAIELRAMNDAELAEAIRQPLRRQARLDGKDKDVDPVLVKQLITDVGGDAARLALMQIALRTLWDEPPHQLVRQRYRGLQPDP